jgi:hypothetical protein
MGRRPGPIPDPARAPDDRQPTEERPDDGRRSGLRGALPGGPPGRFLRRGLLPAAGERHRQRHHLRRRRGQARHGRLSFPVLRPAARARGRVRPGAPGQGPPGARHRGGRLRLLAVVRGKRPPRREALGALGRRPGPRSSRPALRPGSRPGHPGARAAGQRPADARQPRRGLGAGRPPVRGRPGLRPQRLRPRALSARLRGVAPGRGRGHSVQEHPARRPGATAPRPSDPRDYFLVGGRLRPGGPAAATRRSNTPAGRSSCSSRRAASARAGRSAACTEESRPYRGFPGDSSNGSAGATSGRDGPGPKPGTWSKSAAGAASR